MAELTVTVPEAARMLGISDDTLHRLIKAGEFPVLRIRRRTLVSRAQLARWVEEHSAPDYTAVADRIVERWIKANAEIP